jgi:coenzyme PQQ precursor peptide PqqA
MNKRPLSSAKEMESKSSRISQRTLQHFTSSLTKSKSGEITESLAWCPVCMCLCRLHGIPSKLPLSHESLSRSCVSYHGPLSNPNRDTIAVRQENVMKTKVWTRPEVKEIHLGCEINSYAPAEI